MNNQNPTKGNDIKKNPSRDYEKDSQPGTKNFGSDTAGRNEVNPGRMGNKSEVDLNRSGVGGSQGSSSSDSGMKTPSANQSQQSQRQQAQKQPIKGAKTGLNQASSSKGNSAANADDEDLDTDEASMAGSDEDLDVGSDVDTGITAGQKNQIRNSSNSDSARI